MINDVTYLLDEALSDMSRIRVIEREMQDAEGWAAKTPEQRREMEKNLRDLERKATGYNQLGDSTVNLLKIFTAEFYSIGALFAVYGAGVLFTSLFRRQQGPTRCPSDRRHARLTFFPQGTGSSSPRWERMACTGRGSGRAATLCRS